MTFALARSLMLADAVTPAALAQALLVAATRGTSLVRALLATHAIDPARLEPLLERADVPVLRHVAPVMTIVHELPAGMCERLLAVPVRRDPLTGTVDVAVVDARDPHAIEEMTYWLGAPVRTVRTSIAAMMSALHRIHEKPSLAGPHALAAPIWVPPAQHAFRDLSHTPAYGSPLVEAAIGLRRPEGQDAAAAPETPVPRRTPPAMPAAAPSVPPRNGVSLPPPALLAAAVDPKRAALDAIGAAGDRDAILENVVLSAMAYTRKVAVLAVRKDVLVGWTCSPDFGYRATLRLARVVWGLSDPLGAALTEGAQTIARLPKDGTHAPLLAAMHAAPAGEVALCAIRVDGKAVALVLADELGESPSATDAVGAIAEIARVAGESLARLLRDKRRGDESPSR